MEIAADHFERYLEDPEEWDEDFESAWFEPHIPRRPPLPNPNDVFEDLDFKTK
jgi:hypothetical protein